MTLVSDVCLGLNLGCFQSKQRITGIALYALYKFTIYRTYLLSYLAKVETSSNHE